MQDVETKKEEKQTGDFRSDSNFLLGYFEEKDGALLYRYDAERLIIEPWGENSFRVRATKLAKMPEEAQMKIQETLQRIVNEGSGGLICIIL